MTTTSSPGLCNAFSIDVEDYFQVSAFERYIPRDAWHRYPCRLESNVDRLLALLANHHIQATWFILGWVAERFPHLVTAIVNNGHEVASHGYEHRRVTEQNQQQFTQDIWRTKQLLEDITGHAILGYRAASYSLTRSNHGWAHQALRDVGYRYSSSIYPVRHDLYGIPDAPRFYYKPLPDDEFLELPITTVQLFGYRLPGGGGGYFRFYPYRLSRWLIQQVNEREQQPAIFYTHPWECDPEQPRVNGLALKTRFRHYLNLNHTESRLQRLFTDFRWSRIDRIFPIVTT
jgi:polysaccharide deacetylase family protein (PEP-CTERM system associated)